MHRFTGKKKLLVLPLILAALAGFGWVTMLLWNNLMPELFHLPQITFWKAVGLLILFRLLFGFSMPHHKHGHRHNLLREKWEHMSEQEREEFRKNLRKNWFSCEEPQNNSSNTESKL